MLCKYSEILTLGVILIFSFFRTNWFEAVQREYKLVTTKVGIIDLTPFAKFIVKGKTFFC